MRGGHSCPRTRTMSKNSKPATKPLTGIRVLVGRAKHQAGALSAELRQHGADVIEIPFIEIRKPKSFKPLDSALKNLSRYDWLILTSVNGVEAMWARMETLNLTGLEKRREGHGFSRAVQARTGISALAAEGLRIAAIGPATKKAIEQRGAKVDVVPKEYIAESVVNSLEEQSEREASAAGARQSRPRCDPSRATKSRSAGRRSRSLRNCRTAEFAAATALCAAKSEAAASRRDLHQFLDRAQLRGPDRLARRASVAACGWRTGVSAPQKSRRDTDGIDRPSHFCHAA